MGPEPDDTAGEATALLRWLDEELSALLDLLAATTDHSRQVVAATLPGGLEQRAERARPQGTAPTLRWILLHLIGEYARHAGHPDLLRESIDGETGL